MFLYVPWDPQHSAGTHERLHHSRITHHSRLDAYSQQMLAHDSPPSVEIKYVCLTLDIELASRGRDAAPMQDPPIFYNCRAAVDPVGGWGALAGNLVPLEGGQVQLPYLHHVPQMSQAHRAAPFGAILDCGAIEGLIQTLVQTMVYAMTSLSSLMDKSFCCHATLCTTCRASTSLHVTCVCTLKC